MVRQVVGFKALVTWKPDYSRRNGAVLSETVIFCTDSPLSGFALEAMPPEVECVEILEMIHAD